jgi:anti-sigma regulatory factor (Ser/Thr protein kinase)
MVATLEDMLKAIGNPKQILNLTNSAETWPAVQENVYWHPILNYVLDKEFLLTEQRELRIKTTIKEAILNSASAGKNSPTYDIKYTAYAGKNGIVAVISDKGRGFNYEKKLEQTKKILHTIPEEPILRPVSHHPGHAGMFCLLKYATDFTYENRGRKLLIQFNYEPKP